MILHVWKGYGGTARTISLCALLLAVTMLLFSLLLPLGIQIDRAEIWDEDAYVGLLVPDMIKGGAKPGVWVSLQSGGFDQIAPSATVSDARTLAYAYSPTLVPCHVPEHGECEHGSASALMPTSFFCGVVTCRGDDLQEKQYSTMKERIHSFDCHLDEAVTLFPGREMVETLTVKMSHFHDEPQLEPLMEIGKSYLVWGYLMMEEDHTATLYTMRHGNRMHGMFLTENNGKHWLLENNEKSIVSSPRAFPIVPWLSELRMPLEDFWRTEEGKLWQEAILSKGEVEHHSVKLIGTSCLESILSFHRGSAYMVEGRTLEESDELYSCLISEELAAANHLKVGDFLSLSLYRGAYGHYTDHYISFLGGWLAPYNPYDGILEQHNYRIAGIYRTEDDIHDSHAVHPSTIFVKSDSLMATYGPIYVLGSYEYNDGPYLCDQKYSLSFPLASKEMMFAELAAFDYSMEYFLFDDGGYAVDKERLEPLDLAVTTVQQGSHVWMTGGCVSATLAMIALQIVLVGSAKTEIGCTYTVDTPNRRVFWHLYLRQIGVLLPVGGLAWALAAACQRPFAIWWMSRWIDRGLAEEVIAYLPTTPLAAAVGLMLGLLIAIPVALWGMRRKYHYEYPRQEKGEMGHADPL